MEIPVQSPGLPLTVLLVVRPSELVGTYSVSGASAYRERVGVCAVRYDDPCKSWNPVGFHELGSFDPPEQREVQQGPGYGRDYTVPLTGSVLI